MHCYIRKKVLLLYTAQILYGHYYFQTNWHSKCSMPRPQIHYVTAFDIFFVGNQPYPYM